ncbi:MAG: hypothetical protein C4344_04070 [Acidimicrobiia bacterium]
MTIDSSVLTWADPSVSSLPAIIPIATEIVKGNGDALELLLDDIRSQVDLILRLHAEYTGDLAVHLAEAARALEPRATGQGVLAVGMGSSLAAARVLPPLLGSPSVRVEDAGEVLHYGLEGASTASAIIAISQSGRSVETVRVVRELRRVNPNPVVVITNAPDSPLAQLADVVLPLLAGEETVAATKTYLATLIVLLHLANRVLRVAVNTGEISSVAAWVTREVTRDLGEAVPAALAERPALFVVGRGPSLSVADYAALVMKEVAMIPAEGMSGGAFRHGPLEMIQRDVGVVVLAPEGRTTRLAIELALEIADRDRPVWLLTDSRHSARLPTLPALHTTVIPPVSEAVSPLATAIPLQLLAVRTAYARGRQAGSLALVSKVTERE